MGPRNTNSDDAEILQEMRSLRPRVERMLDIFEQRAKEDGKSEAERQRLMADMLYVLAVLQDGTERKPALLTIMESHGSRLEIIEEWRRRSDEAERERQRERRTQRTTVAITVIGWILTLAMWLFSTLKGSGHQ
jgi:hypothetical protein